MRLDIKALVIGVVEAYGTNNPFSLAEILGIHILIHELPNTLNAYRLNNMIIINKELSYENRRWVLAHELGHYFIHGPESTLGNYITNKLLVKAKCEKQADIFASELLLADIDNYVIDGLTSKQLAALFAVPEKYVKYKLAE